MSDAFGSWWRIAKETGIPLDKNLKELKAYPHTITYAIWKRIQIDSFMELPEEERPPQSIWDDQEALRDWFERLKSAEKETGIKITLEDIE